MIMLRDGDCDSGAESNDGFCADTHDGDDDDARTG